MISRITLALLLTGSVNGAGLPDAVSSWTGGVFIAFIGDSITEGNPYYQSVLHGGPSGDTDYDIATQVYLASSGIVTGTNYGYPSRTFATMVADADQALVNTPKYLFVHCGVNDIANSRTWSAVEADLDSLLTTCTDSNAVMILDDIFPWTNGSDEQALIVRTWNTNLTTWASVNGVHRLTSHDALGQTRVSTGELDDLKSEYDNDGVHITAAAYATWAGLIVAKLNEMHPGRRLTAGTINATIVRGQ